MLDVLQYIIDLLKYYNKYRRRPVELPPKLHTEINCLNSIKQKIKLYIYRIKKHQSFVISRPCSSCMAAIKDLGIKNIYYTTNNGFVYKRIENFREGSVV